jgi:ATP-dependent Lhr-like helicase
MSVFQLLCSPLQEWLKNQDWKPLRLRPIQELAYGPITARKNVLLSAPTAVGKTEAAMLPLLNRLQGSQQAGVKILYVAPLRALLNNLESRFLESKLCAAVYFEVFKWHGDVDRSKKLAVARQTTDRLPDVILTTPESLDVILCSPFVNKLSFFAPLDAVVIDETHYFAGSDRGGQLVSVLNRLERILKRDLQRVCLSATVGNAKEVLAWMSASSRREQEVVHPPAEKPQRQVELNYYDPDDSEALAAMTAAVVQGSLGAKSIIFEPSRKAAEQRSKDFKKKDPQCRYSILHVHHSSVDKELRKEAEADLAQAKKAATVIATCTLELGLDVGDLDLIQQEGEFPSVSSYVQRIGRTGRRRPPQRCIAHVTDEFEFLKNLAIMTLAETGFVEANELPRNAYHLLLQQMLMMALGSYGFRIQDARAMLRDCSALKDISDVDFDDLLNFWLAKDVLRTSDGLVLIGHAVEQLYSPTNYRDLYVLFDSPEIFEVWHGRTAIGSLDRIFVHSKTGKFVFILAGKWWQVEEVRYADGVVFVKPVKDTPPPATWISPRGQEVSYRLAQQIKWLLLEDDPCSSILKQTVAKNFLASLREQARRQGLGGDAFQFNSLPNNRNEVVNYAGDRVNLLLTGLAAKKRGWDCDDITYASFLVKLGKNPVNDFAREFRAFAEQTIRDKWLDDEALLAELTVPFDDPDSSKWSQWLPEKYRQRFLAHQVFDVPSTRAWLEAFGSEATKA